MIYQFIKLIENISDKYNFLRKKITNELEYISKYKCLLYLIS